MKTGLQHRKLKTHSICGSFGSAERILNTRETVYVHYLRAHTGAALTQTLRNRHRPNRTLCRAFCCTRWERYGRRLLTNNPKNAFTISMNLHVFTLPPSNKFQPGWCLLPATIHTAFILFFISSLACARWFYGSSFLICSFSSECWFNAHLFVILLNNFVPTILAFFYQHCISSNWRKK